MKKITLALCLVTLFGCKNTRPPVITGFEGKPLPAFTLLLSDSVTYINTQNIPIGKPVVLFYFSPKCPYCRAEMSDIVKDITLLKNLEIYVFTNWSFSAMKQFYDEYQLNKYPNLKVGVDYANYFEGNFNAYGVPYIAIYRKDGLLNKAFVGKIDVQLIKDVAEN